jgi:hypothetical protein
MLRDLEELLLQVQDDAGREQMREAVRCYHAGAYRASEVMAVAAGMYDLRRRVEALAASGAGAAIKKVRDDVEAQERAQGAWETMLLDGSKAHDLISSAEHQKLGLLLKQRHLCAHPTGHRATPEEARAVLTDVIDLVMSRSLLVGGSGVRELVETRLSLPHYFGGDPRRTVSEEIGRLQPRVLPYLAGELAKAITNSPVGSPGRRHAVQFVAEMLRAPAGAGAEARAAAWKGVALILDGTGATAALDVIAHAPEVLASADAMTKGRLLALLHERVGDEARWPLVDAVLEGGALEEHARQTLLDALSVAVLPTLARNKHSNTQALWRASRVAAAISSPDFHARWRDWLIEALGSSTYDIANPAAECFGALDAAALGRWPSPDRVRAVGGLLDSAQNNANEAKRLCASPQAALVALVEDFLDAIETGGVELTVWQGAEHLVRLLHAAAKPGRFTGFLLRVLRGELLAPSDWTDQRRLDLLRASVKLASEAVRDALAAHGSVPAWLPEDDPLRQRLVALMPPAALAVPDDVRFVEKGGLVVFVGPLTAEDEAGLDPNLVRDERLDALREAS